MAISADLLAYLKTVSAVTSLVGAGDKCRIFPDVGKEGAALPCVTYKKRSGGEQSGISGGHGLHSALFEVTSWAASRSAADALDDAIYDNLEGGNRTMGSTVVTQALVRPDGRDSGADPAIDGGDNPEYWARTTYEIWYSE